MGRCGGGRYRWGLGGRGSMVGGMGEEGRVGMVCGYKRSRGGSRCGGGWGTSAGGDRRGLGEGRSRG
jgi:hypothetical protein